jgi:hypothetical protein
MIRGVGPVYAKKLVRRAIGIMLCKYPPAEPGALMIGPLKAAVGVADATPIFWAT